MTREQCVEQIKRVAKSWGIKAPSDKALARINLKGLRVICRNLSRDEQ